jgi:hypothetical protein
MIVRRRACPGCGLVWHEAEYVEDEPEDAELIMILPPPNLAKWARVCPRCGEGQARLEASACEPVAAASSK